MRVIDRCAFTLVLSLLSSVALAAPCYDTYQVDGPEQDLGIYPAHSPNPPVIESVTEDACKTCCSSSIEIEYSGTDADFLRLESGGRHAFVETSSGTSGTVEVPTSAFQIIRSELHISAWYRIGYRSESVPVYDVETRTSGCACVGPVERSATWLGLLVPLFLFRRASSLRSSVESEA